MDDLTALTDSELYLLRDRLLDEINRLGGRRTSSRPGRGRATHTLTVLGRDEGTDWVQPTGAHDAYPAGWTVTHDGHPYESLIPANVWEPGSDPRWWKQIDLPADADDTWDGNYHAYEVGDEVTYEGRRYQVIQAHTSQPDWTPSATPALYTDLGPVT